MKKKALSGNKKWIPYVKPRKHKKKYKSNVATVLFHNLSFRRGRFRLGKRGPFDQNLTRVSMPRVNKFPPSSYFFSNFAYWWAVRSKLGKRGPSDQNMPRVNMPRVNIFPPNKRYEPIGD
jgi:hypothetical protein